MGKKVLYFLNPKDSRLEPETHLVYSKENDLNQTRIGQFYVSLPECIYFPDEFHDVPS